ncbi:MAG: hypothetical protein IPO90_07655 [Flavobacteriales bacterium]|nr:hypothetical protein [Flavobacteriales bacterium]
MTRLDRINERLNLKEFQLGALLDVTKAINNNLQREELLKLYADIMHDELGITRLMLFEHSGGWRCAHAFGADESQQLVDVRPLIERSRTFSSSVLQMKPCSQDSTSQFLFSTASFRWPCY